ncbi:MAG TPA: nuclear transport factor 2 family protein [Rhizomicrobium sp.]|jgi:ketosteroid isomerase-like protein|nr:nuclear transport factor 2 family protein [Rhizomicrobium sp.]
MNHASSPEAVARRLIAEYNRGLPDWVEAVHAETTEWIELPFLGGAGRSGGRAELRKAAELQVANFPDRRMTLLNVVADTDQVALEVEWTGTAALDTAWAKKGSGLTLRAVLILTVKGGRVVKEVDYVIAMPA